MVDSPASSASKQTQFLNVIDRDQAELRFRSAIRLDPIRSEVVPLSEALGRILAEEVVAKIDVPSFDRSNLDGFAVRAEDTFGAAEHTPKTLTLADEVIATAIVPKTTVTRGVAVNIATGGMVPRGANAIVMVEHADVVDGTVLVRKAVSPGFGITFAGTDIGSGETVLRVGQKLTSRETGVLAAIGHHQVTVWQKPKVAIISTGDEIISPDSTMQPGLVFDSNAQILADAVIELGGQPVRYGIVHDHVDQLRNVLNTALVECDVVLLSGGTSKGAGDLSYLVVKELDRPGIVAHGVALKPGKPICLAAQDQKPVVILPGFPTSAVFTFHEFVAPVIRRLAGGSDENAQSVFATMALKVNSEIGRTEYVLVGLVEQVGSDTAHTESHQYVAYPMGKGSGSVTTFSHADGFVTIGRHQEIVEAGETVSVQLLGQGLKLADLVVIGSHCIGLDRLLSRLQAEGFQTKFLAVGSTAGLLAAKRAECDVAGIHLMDAATGEYNRPFVDASLDWIRGYGRQQGLVFRPGDDRFEVQSVDQAVRNALADEKCLMINRNQGSGTRILIDQLLSQQKPAGYAVQANSHHAVVTAVVQHRADWGVAIRSVAERSGLGFLPICDEQYDLVIPKIRRQRPAVRRLVELLSDPAIRSELAELGLAID
ncbi:MAG: molybdopterin biosynthesis protein [Planctomycetales bacterium]|nr:molybdopterin biosynthesis protein [Planctomycetales bacterium]